MAPTGSRLELRLLGSLEVLRDGKPIAVSGPKPRALLADLALHLGEVVSTDRLIEDLWSGSPPRSAGHALQVYVSKLRNVLDREKTGLINSQAPGYTLELPPEALDLHRFERLVADGREALKEGDPSSASASLRKALSLWRGAALADFVYEPFAQTDIARLEDLRTAARESLVDAELELGHHAELLPQIEALVVESPFAERVRAQLMLALYRAGRQADALEAYRDARRELVDELGVEPSTMLRELEQAILRQDTSLELPTAVAWPVEERRKTVTVLFADLVGSTALADELDPESWSGVQRRLFAVLRAALERHGGTVEKFAGDAVMAVFGVPTAHEDDALRAVRAAVTMRTGLAALNAELEQEQRSELALRIGINTGEVFTGGPAGGPLVSGSVVNLAKRLEEAALAGEVLLGTGTIALVRHAVRSEQLRARRGGEEAAVPAFLLVEVIEDAPAIARYLRGPLVGRDEELSTLRNAFEEVRSEGSCRLVTILGEPGIGKTRLANELVASLGEEATVLVGRCVSYGEGATYLPLAEMLAGVNLDTALAGEEEGQPVAERVRELIGVGEGAASSEEGFWAVRRLCQALARERPLALVFEDLHWGEPTLLDLIEHLDERAQGPILLLSVARPELLEKRPIWAATSLSLTPLADEQAEVLVVSLPGGRELTQHDRTQILETAEGNPLFVEQLFAYVHETGSEAHRTIPPTITALLAARLDGLPEEERIVLERASVEGKTFRRAAVVELAPDHVRPKIGERLLTLVGKGLIQPERTSAKTETFRFHHQLVREAAYASLPKGTRAELHERLANWLESSGAAPDEIVGYHLEQALRYREQLRPLDEHTHALGVRAAASLLSARSRAFGRGDFRAVATLLERAVALLPSGNPERRELLPELARSYAMVGEYDRAEATVTEAIEAAHAASDLRQEMHALVVQALGRLNHWLAPFEQGIDPDPALAQRAIAVFKEHRDELGLAKAWRLTSIVHEQQGRIASGMEAAMHQIEHAQSARSFERPMLDKLASGALDGPSPVPDAIRLCERLQGRTEGNRRTEVEILDCRSGLEAMAGRFEDARETLALAAHMREELDHPGGAARSARVELLADDAAAAEAALHRKEKAIEQPVGMYDRDLPILFAETLYRQGRYGEAQRFVVIAQEAAWNDAYLEITWRNARAKLLARAGDVDAGEALAREAVALGEPTDFLNLRGDTLMDLAEVLRLANRTDEAASAIDDAVRLYKQKGNVASARSACALLEDLRASRAAAGGN